MFFPLLCYFDRDLFGWKSALFVFCFNIYRIVYTCICKTQFTCTKRKKWHTIIYALKLTDLLRAIGPFKSQQNLFQQTLWITNLESSRFSKIISRYREYTTDVPIKSSEWQKLFLIYTFEVAVAQWLALLLVGQEIMCWNTDEAEWWGYAVHVLCISHNHQPLAYYFGRKYPNQQAHKDDSETDRTVGRIKHSLTK